MKSSVERSHTSIYEADAGQTFYEEQRMNCGRRTKWTNTDAFIEWADDKMLIEKWSPDALIGFALKQELFDKSVFPCTSTLYQWIDRGVMRIKNMDLLEKLTRKIKLSKNENPSNKRVLGTFIEKRPEIIDSRKTFGHWEIDTVVDRTTKCDAVLLILQESALLTLSGSLVKRCS